MYRKKPATFLVGVAMLILPYLVTAQPASAATITRVSVSAGSAALSDPGVIVPLSWHKATEFEEQWACQEHGEGMVANYPNLFCDWRCNWNGALLVWELWIKFCVSPSDHSQDQPAHAVVKL